MSNFPLVRYKASDIWIPPSDIDGIDANETVLADVTNVDFSNGYIENAPSVTGADFPTNVLASLSSGYTLLSSKTFAHSTQGQQTVYILWKEAADDISTPKLLIYRNDTLLDMDEANVGITYLARPERITYNLANDQLKINLNITASYLVAEPVILNLTLVYLPEVSYNATVTRIAGWYICPRWLGWNHPDGEGITVDSAGTAITQNFELPLIWGQPPFGDFTISGWSRLDTEEARGGNFCLGLTGDPASFDYDNYYTISQIGASSFSFYAKAIFSDTHLSASIEVYKRNANTYAWELADSAVLTSVYQLITLSTAASYGQIKIVARLHPYIPNPFGDPESYEIYIDDLTAAIEDFGTENSGSVVVAKYFDGQRGALKSSDIAFEADQVTLSIDTENIDYRISSYELYTIDTNGAYILVAEFPTNGGWEDITDGVRMTALVVFTEHTVNFKYNLPYDSRVDNQRYIYSEITHKGRIYFVNNDYKVYQSHISTNLAIQADAFPYDEETGFGYFIIDHSKINLALANSPTNDMVIITNQGLYVYFIQPSGSGSFKQLKMGSGNVSISALKSLTSLLNGEPASDGLFWIDYNGIYFYGGGLTAPENLVTATHQRYWEAISYEAKDDAVGFYNPIRKEYWLYVNQEFLIFELSFKKLKKYDGIAGMTEFIGYINLTPQYTNGTVVLTCTPQSRQSAIIETHYNTIEANPEIYHKILQELYLEFGTSDTAVIQMVVYADDWLVGTYVFNSSKRFDKWLSPVGLRFNRLKLKLILPEEYHIKIKEFGFSYSPDMAEPLGITPVNIAASGYGFNYGFNY